MCVAKRSIVAATAGEYVAGIGCAHAGNARVGAADGVVRGAVDEDAAAPVPINLACSQRVGVGEYAGRVDADKVAFDGIIAAALYLDAVAPVAGQSPEAVDGEVTDGEWRS